MDDSFLVLTNDPVNLRDSWDILETPRTSQSETDDTADAQSKVHRQGSSRANSRAERNNYASQHELRVQVRKSKSQTNHSTQSKGRRMSAQGDSNSRDRDYVTGLLYSTEPPARTASSSILKTNKTRLRRPVSAHILSDQYHTSQITPKRYRKLGLRSHDDMLQEQFDKLRFLLDDRENMSKEELGRQHVEQTRKMIADYKSLNRGAKTKTIIISRSLPESLRPKSPRSRSSSSSRGRNNKSSSYSSSRSSSLSRSNSKRVSFKAAPSRGHRHRSESSSASSTSRQRSASPKQKPYQNDSKGVLENLSHDRSPVSADDALSSAENSEAEERDTEENGNSDYKPKFSSVEEELAKRINGKQINSKYTYVSEHDKISSRRKTRKTIQVEQAQENTEFHEQPRTFGVIENSRGLKLSDNNLKRTANPDIKQWLREKEKSIKSMKKKQKQKEEKEKIARELEMQRQAERKAESEKKLREWQMAKRKQARLLRRQNIAMRKLITQDKMSSSETDLLKHPASTIRSFPGPKPSIVQPKAPTKPRPASAPPNRRRVVRPQQIPVEKLIATNPDLKEKLKQLEKQRRLKHRQSYDEWLKIKEKEKKDTLKVIREQRAKIEKEISEETAKVITEAARRRMDNIKYKGSETTQAEKQPATAQEPTESEPPKQDPYTWRTGSPTASRSSSGTSRFKTQRTTPVLSQKLPQPKRVSKKPPVEEVVTPDVTTNPFSDPFKPPKLRRPKSQLEQSSVNGPEFSRFIWELVNEQEKEGNRPEPQGEDSPSKPTEPAEMKETLKPHPPPEPSKSPVPPTNKHESEKTKEPVIESGTAIFSLTSIE